MNQTIIRISTYADENLRNARYNLDQLNILQERNSFLKQRVEKEKRNSIMHENIEHYYNYNLMKLENEIKEGEVKFESLKNSFISNINFTLSYASEILIIEMSYDTNEFNKAIFFLKEISSLLKNISVDINIPLYSLIPKLVEVETRLLLNDNKAKYMNLRIFMRDIKSKIK